MDDPTRSFTCDCRTGCIYVGDVVDPTPHAEIGEPCAVAAECLYHGEDRAPSEDEG